MKVLDIIRKARKTCRDSMNKIETIRVIREARPDVGLKGAKDFWEWIDLNGDGLSAPRLAGHWCEEHWQDNEICGCPMLTVEQEKPEVEVAAKTNRSSPSRQEPEPELSDAENVPDPQQQVQAFNCKCGDRQCRNEWHSLAMWLEQDLLNNYRMLLACADARVNVLHGDKESA